MPQRSAQSRIQDGGVQAQRVLCSSNFAQRVPVQSQKSVLSNQKLSNDHTTQQPRPKPIQATARPQVPSKSNEKPKQAPVPGNSEDVHMCLYSCDTCDASMKAESSATDTDVGQSCIDMLSYDLKQTSSTFFSLGVAALSLLLKLPV